MCFSAEVSFVSAGLLASAGAYCLRVVRQMPRYYGIAVIPLLFAVQQASEGVVWVGLSNGNVDLTQIAALIYLFFATGVWPTWFVISTWMIETNRSRSRFIGLWVMVSTGWFWAYFLPLMRGEFSVLEISVKQHSIQYEYPAITSYISSELRNVFRFLYFLTALIPVLISSHCHRLIVGTLSAGAIGVISAMIFDYAFVSIWCLLSAVLSLNVVYILSKLPRSLENSIESSCDKK